MRYKRIFWAMINEGHSAVKAAEIIVDASRKDQHAIMWIKLITRLHRRNRHHV